MKKIDKIIRRANTPKLLPFDKVTERQLLSVFMALLELVPKLRQDFLERCEYKSGKIRNYSSFMEPAFKDKDDKNERPDGLILCQKGTETWTALIEAKIDKNSIDPSQMQKYYHLAREEKIDALISISNQFASEPTRLPYELNQKSNINVSVFHFAWAEIRATITDFRATNAYDGSIDKLEIDIITHCLEFMNGSTSGIRTFDSMSQSWKSFVSDMATANSGQNKSLQRDCIDDWVQEKRDLFNKLVIATDNSVRPKLPNRKRSTARERYDHDVEKLDNEHILSANYLFQNTDAELEICAQLDACRINVALRWEPIQNKRALTIANHLAKELKSEQDNSKSKCDFNNLDIIFTWAGRDGQRKFPIAKFLNDPEEVLPQELKTAPKTVCIMEEKHQPARFKSPTKFIEDIEKLAFNLVKIGNVINLIQLNEKSELANEPS